MDQFFCTIPIPLYPQVWWFSLFAKTTNPINFIFFLNSFKLLKGVGTEITGEGSETAQPK